jgi:hypothetical protein
MADGALEVTTEDAPTPQGFALVLDMVGLNMFEFGVCAAFWFAAFVLSSFISLEMILGARALALSPRRRMRALAGAPVPHALPTHAVAFVRALAAFPPIAAATAVMSTGASYVPLVGSTVGLIVMIYLLVKHRAFVMKAITTVLRKVTGKR